MTQKILMLEDPYHPLKFHTNCQLKKPLDESSDNSDEPTNPPNKPSGIILPPFFYTKRPKRIPKMT